MGAELLLLAVVSAAFLVPLVPSVILYKYLDAEVDRDNEATGQVQIPSTLGGGKISFSLAGSAAVYILITGAFILLYTKIDYNHTLRKSYENEAAWIVKIPVLLVDQEGNKLEPKQGEMQQLRPELEPPLMRADANEVRVWVKRDRDRFPNIYLSYPTLGLEKPLVNLNDKTEVEYFPLERKLVVKEPVKIMVQSDEKTGESIFSDTYDFNFKLGVSP